MGRVERLVQYVWLDKDTGGDEVFKLFVLGRLIEPTSRLDTIRVLDKMNFDAINYCTTNADCRCMPKPSGVSS